MSRKLILVLISLLLIPVSLSQSSLDVDYVLTKGSIEIIVDGESYLNLIEVFKGPFSAGVKPETVYLSVVNLGCGNACQGKKIVTKSFDELRIYEPGEYYFVVKDIKDEATRVDFTVAFDNLLGCEFQGTYIKNKQCLSDVIAVAKESPVLRSLYCANKELVDRCAGPGFCGCPSTGYICCNNENLEECKGKLGKCVPVGEKVQEIKVEEKRKEAVTVIEQLGCSFADYPKLIPENVCANMVVPGLLRQLGHQLFSGYCECTSKSKNEFDKDGDGYDDSAFKGGTDCDDRPAGKDGKFGTVDDGGKINPGVVESCELANNKIDENCDTVDLDCGLNCDYDEDGYLNANKLGCSTIAKLTNKKLEINDEDKFANPGALERCNGKDDNENNKIDEGLSKCACTEANNDRGLLTAMLGRSEVCRNNKDDNCNDQIDESSCRCNTGETKPTGVCDDGIARCDGGVWVEKKEPSSICQPKVFVGNAEEKINVNSGDDVTVRAELTCSEIGGCGDIDVVVG